VTPNSHKTLDGRIQPSPFKTRWVQPPLPGFLRFPIPPYAVHRQVTSIGGSNSPGGPPPGSLLNPIGARGSPFPL